MRSLTIGRQVLLGYLAPLLAMALLIFVALAALSDLRSAKDRVIKRDAVLVIDAYRLNVALGKLALNRRSFLLTRDDRFSSEARVHDADIASTIAALQSRVHTDEGRRLIEEVRARIEVWDQESARVAAAFRDGALAPGEVARVVQETLAPRLSEVEATVEELQAREERLIAEAMQASDAAARRARIQVWVLGGLAGLLGVSIGGWTAFAVNRRLGRLATTIDDTAREILAGTSEQAAGAAQQAAAVQQTVTTVDELVQTARQSAERARSVADGAQRSAEVARAGTEAIATAVRGMAEVREQVEGIAHTVVSLADRAQAISDIVTTVEDIADRTHLLALNAAIEAARAGEQGRGFGVVAAEVRSLADQAKVATGEVARILGEIQAGTHRAVMTTESGTASVVAGTANVEHAGETIVSLADTVARAALAAEQIAASSGQQAVATTQISEAMRGVDEVVEQTASASRQAERAAGELRDVAIELKALVGAV